jgi:hypothetical protein
VRALFPMVLGLAESSYNFADIRATQKVFPADQDFGVITAMPQHAHYLHPLIAICRRSD